MYGHSYGRCHQPGIKKLQRKKQKKKPERRKETEYTMCFATLWYCMYGRAVELTANVRFFFCRRHVSSRTPVVIRSTRIGSRVEAVAPSRASLRVVVHATHDSHLFLARPPTISTPACTHTPSLLRPLTQSQFTRQTTRLAQSPPPDHPTRAGAPYAQQAPSRTCTTHTTTSAWSRQFQFRHIKKATPAARP
jgi:hypothetical protein